jgi:hypothetical protein
MYEEIGRELASGSQSYYIDHSWVMRPAVEAIQEGGRLQANNHSSAAVVFFVSAIELLLKATLLKPVVHGLVQRRACMAGTLAESDKQDFGSECLKCCSAPDRGAWATHPSISHN